MPKVTEAHREARRQQIGRAALTCLRRNGVSNTSMADIIAESGLSAGAIYSNFRNKAELAAYVAAGIMSARADYFAARAADASSPLEVAAGMLELFEGEDAPFAVVLQFWAEATSDPEMLGAVLSTVGALRSEFGNAIEPWVRLTHPADVAATTERLAIAMISVCQGYILTSALAGRGSPRDYLESVAAALASPSSAGS
jgi:AcrR family transcriptional regulator